jgi:hypothetical protein
MSTDTITFEVAGALVSLPQATISKLWLDQLTEPDSFHGVPRVTPAIGTLWPAQGGVYAGIVRGDEGQPDYHLIVADTDHAPLPWQAALDWAKGLDCTAGHRDFTLPKRKEQAVMFGNVPELFQKFWYWSCEQYAGNDEYAWIQNFRGGYQSIHPKYYESRARAVRRVPI